MIVALRSSSYLVGCLRIIVSSSLLFFMDIIDTMIPMVKILKDFDKFLFFMKFWRFGQTTIWPKFVISAWTFRKLQMVFCGHIVV